MRLWLKERLRQASRQSRIRTRAWLQRHRRIRNFLRRTGSLDVDEFTLARGVAVGLFIGFTPTVGIQTALMLAASVALRANFPAAFIASWVSNPLTLAPLYIGFHSLGEQLLEYLPIRFDPLAGLEEEIAAETTALILGSLAIAVPAGLLGYVGFLYVWRRFDLHLPERADRLVAEAEDDPAEAPQATADREDGPGR